MHIHKIKLLYLINKTRPIKLEDRNKRLCRHEEGFHVFQQAIHFFEVGLVRVMLRELKIERLSNGIRFYQRFLRSRLSSGAETAGLFCSHQQTLHAMTATRLTSQFTIIPKEQPHIWNAWPLLMGIMRILTILTLIPIPQLAQLRFALALIYIKKIKIHQKCYSTYLKG